MNRNPRRDHFRLSRSLLIIAVAAVVPVLIVLPGAARAMSTAAIPAAHAASHRPPNALPSCPDATLCTFQNSGYGGTRWNFSYSSHPHDTWFFVGAAANDQISSFYNQRAWASFMGKNCPVGSQDFDTIEVSGGAFESNIAAAGWTWGDNTVVNDSISAIALSSSSNPTSYPNPGQC